MHIIEKYKSSRNRPIEDILSPRTGSMWSVLLLRLLGIPLRFQCTSEQISHLYCNSIYYVALLWTWKPFITYFYRLSHTWFYWLASPKKEGRAALYLIICLNLSSLELISDVTSASKLSKMITLSYPAVIWHFGTFGSQTSRLSFWII